jgi:DNA-binding CsgD family transcriptional regulator
MRRREVRHEVWAKALWTVLDIAAQGDIDTERLLEGMPFDAKQARRLRRIAWDDYVTIGDRVEDIVGGPEALAELCQLAFPRVTPELRMMPGSVFGAKTLLRLFFQVFNPLVFPPLEFVYEDLGEDRVHLEVWQKPGARQCRSFYAASIGIIRGISEHVALPVASVEGMLTAEHMEWDVELPRSRTIAQRARDATSALITRVFANLVLGYDDEGAPIGVGTTAPESAGPGERIDRATQQWTLTPRQIKVLEVLVQGKSNKEIANALGCAENTVELHVTQLLKRAKVTSRGELIARFWSEAS